MEELPSAEKLVFGGCRWRQRVRAPENPRRRDRRKSARGVMGDLESRIGRYSQAALLQLSVHARLFRSKRLLQARYELAELVMSVSGLRRGARTNFRYPRLKNYRSMRNGYDEGGDDR